MDGGESCCVQCAWCEVQVDKENSFVSASEEQSYIVGVLSKVCWYVVVVLYRTHS